MQYRRLAVSASGSEKTCRLERSTEGSSLQPTGIFTQGHDINFHFNQPLRTIFDLRGTVLQPSFADRNSGRGITQGFALNQ